MQRESKKSLASRQHHYITIQARTRTADGEGGFTETWTDGDTVPAAVYAIQARQQFEYDTINVHATHRVEIRGLVTISETDNRIKFGTRYLEILTVENIQERDEVKVITCNEIRA
jgi:SPP1 family predicted phage head-tail adaptor